MAPSGGCEDCLCKLFAAARCCAAVVMAVASEALKRATALGSYRCLDGSTIST
jgi:hypothetical protein